MLVRSRCRNDGVHGPAASTPSADVLSTPLHHGSASGRPSLEAYPRCCSPPDSNMNQTEIRFKSGELGGHISGGINSGVSLSLQHGDCHVHDVLVPHLAEKGSNPRKQSGYPAEAYSAEQYSDNYHRWFQEVQLRSTKTGHCHRNHQRLHSGVVV